MGFQSIYFLARITIDIIYFLPPSPLGTDLKRENVNALIVILACHLKLPLRMRLDQGDHWKELELKEDGQKLPSLSK